MSAVIHHVPVCFAQKHCGNGDLCSATQSDFAGSQHGLCLSNEEAKWLEWNEVKATIRTSDLVDRLKENSPAVRTVPPNPAAWFDTSTMRTFSLACATLLKWLRTT